MNSKKKGKEGEAFAADFLMNLGYRIIRKNFRWRRGEIDIIAEYSGSIIFIEVKNWEFYDISDMEFALNSVKQQKIIQTSRYYLFLHPEFRDYRVRYDLILLRKSMTNVEHFINAFTETGAV